MPAPQYALPLALLTLWSAVPCHAQTWDADSSVRQFALGPVNVLVIADTVTGLGVWAATSSTKFHGDRREFGASFDPDSIELWLDQAHAVITHSSDADSGKATALLTVPLISVDSSGIVVLRERSGSRWSDRIELVFVDRGRKPLWSVAVRADEATAFITSLFIQASRSRLMPPGQSSGSLVSVDDPALADAAPMLVHAGNVRPPRSVAGISATVLLEFVIGTNGKPEPGSFRTIEYSDPRFVDAAIETLRRSRFKPGKIDGVPVRVRVAQRVAFHGGARQQHADNFPQPRFQVGNTWPPF